jgi:hypothetical protein
MGSCENNWMRKANNNPLCRNVHNRGFYYEGIPYAIDNRGTCAKVQKGICTFSMPEHWSKER